jgi:protein involved in polysaccharide export with SLBB domain
MSEPKSNRKSSKGQFKKGLVTAATAAGVGAAMVGMSSTSGCQRPAHLAKPASEAPMATTRAAAALGPGDEVEIKFYYAPELNVQQKVRPDGMISMQLIGDVKAAGLTPAELDDTLQKAYATQLRFPEVAVIVRGQYSRRVYVSGEVQRPGPIDMPADLSLWEAVILAGGFNMRNADRTQVIVVRHLPDGTRQGYAVDMKDQMAGAGHKPFELQPMDIVYVPRESVVDLGEWIDKNINDLIPKTGFVYTVRTGNTTVGYDGAR